MTMATAALLTATIRADASTFIDAIVGGQRTWIRFKDADIAGAMGDIAAAHRSIVQAFEDLNIPHDQNTRVILDVRMQVEAISPTVLEATQWSCPPIRQPRAQRNVAVQHLAAA